MTQTDMSAGGDDILQSDTAALVMRALLRRPEGATANELARAIGHATADRAWEVLRTAAARHLATPAFPTTGRRRAGTVPAVWTLTDRGRDLAATLKPKGRRASRSAPRRRLPPDVRAALITLLGQQYAAGASIRDLAERHDLSYGTARRYVVLSGTTLRAAGLYHGAVRRARRSHPEESDD
nr:hypothetical protein [Micromonospora sp. DSM 115978]